MQHSSYVIYEIKGARAIASNLKYNHVLSVLGLEGNPIPVEVMTGYFAECVASTLVTPLTLISFENAEFQKKVNILSYLGVEFILIQG